METKALVVIDLQNDITIPILAQYNGEHGKWKGMKWLFYVYYPAHLVVIGILRIQLYGNAVLIF